MNIGIVGLGYVGTAIKSGFEKHYELETYDKYDESKSTCDLADLVAKCKVIFVCVPTPMNIDGSCHTDIVESVIKDIDKWCYAYWGNYDLDKNTIDNKPIVVQQIDYIENIRVLMLYSTQSFLLRPTL